jgi:hypothetical protein
MLSVLKRVIEELDAEILSLASGTRAIFDVKGGKIVVTSQETLLEKRVFKDRLSELISRIEAADVPRIQS